jgi:hypothetical protein
MQGYGIHIPAEDSGSFYVDEVKLAESVLLYLPIVMRN